MKTPPLPPKFSLADGFLTDPEGYHRYALNGSGNLDRGLIASVIENWGHRKHAAEWRGETTGDLIEALSCALAALEAIAPHCRMMCADEAIRKGSEAIAKVAKAESYNTTRAK